MAMRRSGFIKLAGCASLGGFASSRGLQPARTSDRARSRSSDRRRKIGPVRAAGEYLRKQWDLSRYRALGSGAAIFAAVLGGAADFGPAAPGRSIRRTRGVCRCASSPRQRSTRATIPTSFCSCGKMRRFACRATSTGKRSAVITLPTSGSCSARLARPTRRGRKSLRAIGLSSARQLEALEAVVSMRDPQAAIFDHGDGVGKFRKLGTPFD